MIIIPRILLRSVQIDFSRIGFTLHASDDPSATARTHVRVKMPFIQREKKREISFDVHVLYLNKIVVYLIVLEFDNIIVINPMINDRKFFLTLQRVLRSLKQRYRSSLGN